MTVSYDIKSGFNRLLNIIEDSKIINLSAEAIEYVINVVEVVLLSLYDTSEFQQGFLKAFFNFILGKLLKKKKQFSTKKTMYHF